MKEKEMQKLVDLREEIKKLEFDIEEMNYAINCKEAYGYLRVSSTRWEWSLSEADIVEYTVKKLKKFRTELKHKKEIFNLM